MSNTTTQPSISIQSQAAFPNANASVPPAVKLARSSKPAAQPNPNYPTSLLWAHQLKREHGYLLDRVKALEASAGAAPTALHPGVGHTSSAAQELEAKVNLLEVWCEDVRNDSDGLANLVRSRNEDIDKLFEHIRVLELEKEKTAKHDEILQRLEKSVQTAVDQVYALEKRLVALATQTKNEKDASRGMLQKAERLDSVCKSLEERMHAVESAVSNLTASREHDGVIIKDVEDNLAAVKLLVHGEQTQAQNTKALIESIHDETHTMKVRTEQWEAKLTSVENQVLAAQPMISPATVARREAQAQIKAGQARAKQIAHTRRSIDQPIHDDIRSPSSVPRYLEQPIANVAEGEAQKNQQPNLPAGRLVGKQLKRATSRDLVAFDFRGESRNEADLHIFPMPVRRLSQATTEDEQVEDKQLHLITPGLSNPTSNTAQKTRSTVPKLKAHHGMQPTRRVTRSQAKCHLANNKSGQAGCTQGKAQGVVVPLTSLDPNLQSLRRKRDAMQIDSETKKRVSKRRKMNTSPIPKATSLVVLPFTKTSEELPPILRFAEPNKIVPDDDYRPSSRKLDKSVTHHQMRSGVLQKRKRRQIIQPPLLSF